MPRCRGRALVTFILSCGLRLALIIAFLAFDAALAELGVRVEALLGAAVLLQVVLVDVGVVVYFILFKILVGFKLFVRVSLLLYWCHHRVICLAAYPVVHSSNGRGIWFLIA